MADIDDYIKPEGSLIDLDSKDVKGDIGLGGQFILERVSMDTIVLEMTDIQGGLKKQGKLLYSNEDSKAWRKGRVLMVGPLVKEYKPGQLVMFPGVRGLEAGEVRVRTDDGDVKFVKHGYFLSEKRLFGELSDEQEQA